MSHDKDIKNECVELSQRDIGRIVAALLLCLLFVFIAGYFLGKKHMLEEIAAQQHDAYLVDKVQTSLFSRWNDDCAHQKNGEELQNASAGETEQGLITDSSQENKQENRDEQIVVASEPKLDEELAFAQLCGFGTKKAADAYVKKLSKRGIGASVVERKSRTKRGRKISWYQVVTDTMEKDQLLNVVERVKKQDTLQGVTIIDVPVKKV